MFRRLQNGFAAINPFPATRSRWFSIKEIIFEPRLRIVVFDSESNQLFGDDFDFKAIGFRSLLVHIQLCILAAYAIRTFAQTD